MKNVCLLIVALLFVLPSVLAINIDVEKATITDVVIVGLDEPAIFELAITNNGNDNTFEFYNLFGWTMEPSEVSIDEDDTTIVNLAVYPRPDLEIRNFYTLPYFIRAQDDSEIEDKITVKILDLEDMFEVGASSFDPEANSIQIYIHNRENFAFEDLDVVFSSKFFEREETFDLGAHQREDFNVTVDKDDIKSLTAGFYTLTASVSIGDLSSEVYGSIKFDEKEIIEVIKKEYGLIVSTKIIEQINEGNTVQRAEVTFNKNLISRLFTSFSPEPNVVERQGGSIYYTWKQDLKPGETLKVVVKTNWLYPLLIIILIVVIVVLVKKITTTDVVIKKRVRFVKAKGGEFALRVSLFIRAKKYVERVSVIDRLPALMKLYEKFGGQKPSKINEKARTLEWNFEKLEEGEVRTLSYVVYSRNVGIMGKFALPSAVVIYQKEGEIKDTESNKAYFMAEPRTKDELDY